MWQKKVWQINRSTNMLLIVSNSLDDFSLDDFSLVNHRQFAKLSCYTVCSYVTQHLNAYNMHVKNKVITKDSTQILSDK